MAMPFSKIVGYHTCGQELGERVAAGEIQLRPGVKDHTREYDWLGTGVYFWVGNYLMARWWINEIAEKAASGFRGVTVKFEIDPGNCLNLSDARYLLRLRAHEASINWAARGTRPRNIIAPTGDRIEGEYKQRFLDHAVIDDYCTNVEPDIESVYSPFQCGLPIYDGAGFYQYNHAQLAVRENGLHRMIFVGIDIP
jgi:hypothetical protein